MKIIPKLILLTLAFGLALAVGAPAEAADSPSPSSGAAGKKPNILILMTDDTGWGDFGCYGGGANLGHPTPNIDRVAKEGAVFTC